MRAERITIQNIRRMITCEADAYVYLEDLRWGDTPICAHCGSERVNLLNPQNGISRKTRTGANSERRVWKCYACRKQFSVITGTIMHGTKVSLEIWVFILFEMCANKNGLAAREIEPKYGLTAKTSWFITQRIREAMKREPLAGMMSGRVEADETFIGGKLKSKHEWQRTQIRPLNRANDGGGHPNKTVVLSLVDRQTGEVYSQVVPDVTGANIAKAISKVADTPNTNLITDGGDQYKTIANQFASHESVNHTAGEYARGHVTTNRAEGYFSQLKRSIDGTHHHVSTKHLPRYLAEFDFRYSTRKYNDSQRTWMLVERVGGKRLTYKPLRDGGN